MISTHPRHKVIDISQIGPYRLKLQFEDNTLHEINFEPVLEGGLYGPLRDPILFQTVRIDPDFHTLVWANDADFNPNTLYDWDELLPILIERARTWKLAHSNA